METFQCISPQHFKRSLSITDKELDLSAKKASLISSPATSSSPIVSVTTKKKPASGQPRNATHSMSKHITMEILRPHFEKPLVDVAKLFGICTTLMKKVCRRVGIKRWPHRHIRSLRKSIVSMETAMSLFSGPDREAYEIQIRKQKIRLVALLFNPNSCEESEEEDAEKYYKHIASSESSETVSSPSLGVSRSTIVPPTLSPSRVPSVSFPLTSFPTPNEINVSVARNTASLWLVNQQTHETILRKPFEPTYIASSHPVAQESHLERYVYSAPSFPKTTSSLPTLPPISSWLR